MHYFKRNIGEYHKKAGKLSMLEHGAYTLLIDACYDREKFPTLDDAIDWCWARSDEELAAVHFVLKKFFTLIDGFYVQNRIREEIDQYHANALTNKEIALNREAKKRAAKARTVHEPITDEHERAPKQEPLTKNQEPIKKSTAGKPSVSLLAWLEKIKLEGESPIPEGDPIFDYASDAGIPVEYLRATWVEFKTEFSEKSDKKKDWRAHFRNFVRKNYYALWWVDNGEYKLTSRGQQAVTAMNNRDKREAQ